MTDIARPTSRLAEVELVQAGPDQRAGHHRTSPHAGDHEEIVSRTATMRSLTEADLIIADKRASKYGANSAVADIGVCSWTCWVTRRWRCPP